MKDFKLLIWILILGTFFSCEIKDEIDLGNNNELDLSQCPSSIITSGKYYEMDNQAFLWADEDSSKHFNITAWTLNACNLRHGIGRENFQALINPLYDSPSDVIDKFNDDDPAVLVKTSTGVKIYPLRTLVVYEAVNDMADGNPILIVYCFLADLVTVYDRRYCGNTLTFGVSGYTYADKDIKGGLESFILWDRNSESLWWPITDRGVSGAFRGFSMNKYNSAQWEMTTMKNVFDNYPSAKILRSNQTVTPPSVPKINGC